MAETHVSDNTELLERGEPDGTSVPKPLQMSRILQVSTAFVAVIGAALVWSGHGIASHMQSIASASLPETLGLSETEATADFQAATQTFQIVNKDGWYLATKPIHSMERQTYGKVIGHKATCVQERPFDADEAWVTSRETVSTGVANVIKPAMDLKICLCEQDGVRDKIVATSKCADAKLNIQYDGKFLFASHGKEENSREDREKLLAVCCDDQGVKIMEEESILHEDSMCVWRLEPVIGSLSRDSWPFKYREDSWAGLSN